MDDDVWTLSFRAQKGWTPAEQRVKRLLKIARSYGLVCVADWRLRQAVIDECCRALCPDCAAGLAVVCDADLFWWHRQTGHLCGAESLRAALQQRRAKDAANRGLETSAPLSQVPQDAFGQRGREI